MKVKELRKKSSVRVDIRYLQQIGIQSYGMITSIRRR